MGEKEALAVVQPQLDRLEQITNAIFSQPSMQVPGVTSDDGFTNARVTP